MAVRKDRCLEASDDCWTVITREIIPFMKRASIALALFCFALSARAETATLLPAGDTAIREITPDNNFGGWTDMSVGGLANPGPSGTLRNRGLLRFTLTGIPAGATITSVTLTLSAT